MNAQDDTGVVAQSNASTQEGVSDAAQTTIDCGSSIDISMVKTLYDRMQQALACGKPVLLDAENVECADGAGLQLLYVFFNDAKAKGIQLDWKGPSAAIKRSASLMGMTEKLQISM